MQKTNILGKTGFNISPFGFGAYRIDKNVAGSEASLKLAITNGINLIDTSSNYFDGGSEKLIGKVISELLYKNEIKRSDLVIVTKGGYIQGDTMELVERKKKLGKPYKEVVKCGKGFFHSIHPKFLKDQIEISLRNLKLDFLDVYLLHNPEYFLLYNPERELSSLRNEYYRRIGEAFLFLEEEVKQGRIKHYGISSNTFVDNSDKRSFTSLEKVIETVESISTKNHFSVVQTPLNIFEKNAVINLNQKDNSISFLQAAAANNLGVLINRPLNSIKEGKLFRLADFEIIEDRTEREIDELKNQQQRLETEIIQKYKTLIPLNQKNELIELLSLSKYLKLNLKNISGVTHFNEIKSQYLIPQINFALQEIYNLDTDNPAAVSLLNQFAVTVNILLNSIGSIFAKSKNMENEKIHLELNDYFVRTEDPIPLSQKAVKLISDLPEVSCVLIGMRKENYVRDILAANNLDTVKNIYDFWKIN